MTPRPRKRGPKPQPKGKLLADRLTIRFRRVDKRALERLAGDQKASDWARDQLLAVIQRAGAGPEPIELGEGRGRILVVDGAVWWSPGLGQWVPLVARADGRGVAVSITQDPVEVIRSVTAKEIPF